MRTHEYRHMGDEGPFDCDECGAGENARIHHTDTYFRIHGDFENDYIDKVVYKLPDTVLQEIFWSQITANDGWKAIKEVARFAYNAGMDIAQGEGVDSEKVLEMRVRLGRVALQRDTYAGEVKNLKRTLFAILMAIGEVKVPDNVYESMDEESDTIESFRLPNDSVTVFRWRKWPPINDNWRA